MGPKNSKQASNETNAAVLPHSYYKEHGLCKECKQLNTSDDWCQSCNANHFRQNFKNWTSGNHYIDEFIQNAQLNAKNYKEVLEWIEYDRFEYVEVGFGT